MRVQSLPPVTLAQLQARSRPSLACAKSPRPMPALSKRKPRSRFARLLHEEAETIRAAKERRLNRARNEWKLRAQFPPGPDRDAALALAKIIDGEVRL